MKRTKVIEIVAAREIVFALAHSGVCAAFSRGAKILKLLLLLHTNHNFDYINLYIFEAYIPLKKMTVCYFGYVGCRDKQEDMFFEC